MTGPRSNPLVALAGQTVVLTGRSPDRLERAAAGQQLVSGG